VVSPLFGAGAAAGAAASAAGAAASADAAAAGAVAAGAAAAGAASSADTIGVAPIANSSKPALARLINHFFICIPP